MSGRDPVELEELSSVGFGCYRVDLRSAQHRAALEQALLAGCNLIDTASNYADGLSEELVGSVLEATPSRAFVVTKAGYVSPSAIAQLARAGVQLDRLPRLESGTPYSIEPTVLRVLIELSRSRLRQPILDAVLLHNPERLAETGASGDEVRAALERAFVFLDDEVKAGRLRFYGISSNDLPAAERGDPLDLETIAEIASSAADPQRLRFVEFPLNLLERKAATDGTRPSLLTRAAGLRTLANRPLNAIVDGQKVRLALPAADTDVDDSWEACVDVVTARLAALGQPEPWTSFSPMQFLRDNRESIPDPDLVDAIWANQIGPFVSTLFDGDPTREAREIFGRMRARARIRAQAALAETTRTVVARLAREGILNEESDESLAVAACRYCLDAGADHVLVGMRRTEYVAEFAHLFANAPSFGPR